MSEKPSKKHEPGPLESIDQPLGTLRAPRSQQPTRPSRATDGQHAAGRAARSNRPTQRFSDHPVSAVHTQSMSPPLNEAPTLLDAEPGRFCFGFYRDISLVYWHDQATGEAMKRLQGLTAHMLQAHPKGHSNVSFVRGGVPLPTDDVRDAFAHVFDGRLSGLHCMSVVIEGEGFWASSLRSTVTSISMSVRSRLEIQLNNCIEDAAAWLAPAHSRAVSSEMTSAELRGALRQARAAMARAVDAPALE